jgi:undecaprenyl-diphosphatase
MQKREAERENSCAGERRSRERSGLALARPEPCGALEDRDEPGEKEHPRHREHATRRAAPWTIAAALATVATLLLAGLAHAADSGETPSAGALTVPLAALLGALQGATEFLPVSSSGHLALGQRIFGIDAESAGHRFSIAVHAGTLLAVLWIYRRELYTLVTAALHPGTKSDGRDWIVAIVVATLPLGIVLVPQVEDAVLAVEGQPKLVGVALWFTALVLFLGFRRAPAPSDRPPDPRAPSLRTALGIGLAQLVAVLPGVSRSGSTISAALALGLDRERAARFSFLISIPAISGAVVLKVKKILDAPSSTTLDPLPYAVGFLTALVVGFLCLRLLLVLVRGGRITPFVIYLAIVGTIAVVLG